MAVIAMILGLISMAISVATFFVATTPKKKTGWVAPRHSRAPRIIKRTDEELAELELKRE